MNSLRERMVKLRRRRDDNPAKPRKERFHRVHHREGLRSIAFEVPLKDVSRLGWSWQPRDFDEAVRRDQRRVRIGGVRGFQLHCEFNYRYLPPHDYGERALESIRFWRTCSNRDRAILHHFDETQRAMVGILSEPNLSYEQVVGSWFPSYTVWMWEFDGVVVVHDISDFRNTLLDRVRVRRKFATPLELMFRRRDKDFIRLREQGREEGRPELV